MDPDRGANFTADVTVGVETPGLFAGAIAAAVFGLGLILAAFVVWRTGAAASREDDSDAATDVGAP
jgi:hypothetical protein